MAEANDQDEDKGCVIDLLLTVGGFGLSWGIR